MDDPVVEMVADNDLHARHQAHPSRLVQVTARRLGDLRKLPEALPLKCGGNDPVVTRIRDCHDSIIVRFNMSRLVQTPALPAIGEIVKFRLNRSILGNMENSVVARVGDQETPVGKLLGAVGIIEHDSLPSVSDRSVDSATPVDFDNDIARRIGDK